MTAVASRARAGDELVRSVHGVDELPELLPRHDVVIVIVPLSEHTAGLVDDAFLAALPDGALVVNVARGGSSTPTHSSARAAAGSGRPRRHRPRAAAARPPALDHARRPHHAARGWGVDRVHAAGGAPAPGTARGVCRGEPPRTWSRRRIR